MGSWDGEVAGVYVPILVKRLVDGIRKQSSEFGLWRVDTVSAGDLEGLIVHVTWGRHFIIFAGEKCSSLKPLKKLLIGRGLKRVLPPPGTREQPVLLLMQARLKRQPALTRSGRRLWWVGVRFLSCCGWMPNAPISDVA